LQRDRATLSVATCDKGTEGDADTRARTASRGKTKGNAATIDYSNLSLVTSSVSFRKNQAESYNCSRIVAYTYDILSSKFTHHLVVVPCVRKLFEVYFYSRILRLSTFDACSSCIYLLSSVPLMFTPNVLCNYCCISQPYTYAALLS